MSTRTSKPWTVKWAESSLEVECSADLPDHTHDIELLFGAIEQHPIGIVCTTCRWRGLVQDA